MNHAFFFRLFRKNRHFFTFDVLGVVLKEIFNAFVFCSYFRVFEKKCYRQLEDRCSHSLFAKEESHGGFDFVRQERRKR